MTNTTILHAAVAREIARIRMHMGEDASHDNAFLEAHDLAAKLTQAVTLLIEHSRQQQLAANYN